LNQTTSLQTDNKTILCTAQTVCKLLNHGTQGRIQDFPQGGWGWDPTFAGEGGPKLQKYNPFPHSSKC